MQKVLCIEEARLFRKMMVEWSDGDENGFPVQLALLTRAQWRAAALVPQAVNESRKLIELHLAEYRRQTKFMLDGFSGAAQKPADEFRAAAGLWPDHSEGGHAYKLQIVDAELVARRVKLEMEDAESTNGGILKPAPQLNASDWQRFPVTCKTGSRGA